MAANEKRRWPSQAALWALALTLALIVAPAAQAGVNRHVRLPTSGRAVTVRGAVVRGDRDLYTLRALAGERLTVHVTAREHNAVFQIIGPSGHFLPGAGEGDDAVRWHGRLPTTGDYTVTVGGTRGNAAYTLTISRSP